MECEIHIPEDAQLEEKIENIIIGVCKAKVEASRVQFEINTKITKLQLKLQSTTMCEV